jgi:hypothetical protein
MAKDKLGLKELSLDQKVDLATTIKTAMTGNANFARRKIVSRRIWSFLETPAGLF